MKFKIEKHEAVVDGQPVATEFKAKPLTEAVTTAGKLTVEWPAPPKGYVGRVVAHYVLQKLEG